MSVAMPLRNEGCAVVVRGSDEDKGLCVASPAVAVLDGAVCQARVRRLHDYAAEDPHMRDVLMREARLLMTLNGAGTPRLIQAYGDAPGRIVGLVEAMPGGLKLRGLLNALNEADGTAPLGLALHVSRGVLRPWLTLERLGVTALMSADIRDVHVEWDGGIVVDVDSYPGWDEQVRGAMTGVIRAPLRWMPPEVALGQRVSPRAFMFSIAVLMLEVLVGKHPYEQEARQSDLQLLRALVERPLPRASASRRDVPPLIDAIVERCARQPANQRFPTWAELDAALADAADRLDPFGAPEVVGMLANLRPHELAWGLEVAEQYAVIRIEELAAEVTPVVNHVIPVKPLEADPPAPPLAEWEEPTEPYAEVNAWGRDARPMVQVGRLLIDARPVTNAEYARFVISSGHAAPTHWAGPTPPTIFEDTAVTYVTQDDARAYASWADKRLPTSDEWSRAVETAGDLRLGTGAVWEWTASGHGGVGHVVRGGRWRDRLEIAAVPSNGSYENEAAADVGFRCVADET